MAFPVKIQFVKNTGKFVFTQRTINRKMNENKVVYITQKKITKGYTKCNLKMSKNYDSL